MHRKNAGGYSPRTVSEKGIDVMVVAKPVRRHDGTIRLHLGSQVCRPLCREDLVIKELRYASARIPEKVMSLCLASSAVSRQ